MYYLRPFCKGCLVRIVIVDWLKNVADLKLLVSAIIFAFFKLSSPCKIFKFVPISIYLIKPNSSIPN